MKTKNTALTPLCMRGWLGLGIVRAGMRLLAAPKPETRKPKLNPKPESLS